MNAMKLTTGILATAMMVGGAWAAVQAQETDAIDQARSVAKSLQQKQANDSNAALEAAGVGPAASDKPAPGAPAPAVKPAVIPNSEPIVLPPPKPASKPEAKAEAPAPKAATAASKPAPKAAASQAANQLQRVNVVQAPDGVHVEIVAKGSLTPNVTKLSSPARVLVELPETAVATSQNKVPFGSAGVKGVRIGMDGKNPPTTSVVVDLESPLAYEMNSSADGKLVLVLHGDGAVAKSNPAPAKSAAPAAQPKEVAAKTSAPAPKVAVAKESKPAAKESKPAKSAAAETKQAKAEPAPKSAAAAASTPAPEAAKAEPAKPKQEDKKWAMNGKRDPFFSPVVQQNGSGCSTGKKCLEIGNINLRGVVKSDNGFIAVVTNNLNKAYFLRENDPVFNGYVVRITGDSVVFQETIQDKLGKPFTREVVKRIFTPAV